MASGQRSHAEGPAEPIVGFSLATNRERSQVPRLTTDEFAVRFQEVWHSLWYIAAAVLGERAGADDVLQEAAMIGLAKLSQFDRATNFTAWMGRIVRLTALNHARRRVKIVAQSADPMALDSIVAARHELAASTASPLSGRGELPEGSELFDDRLMAALRTLDDTARACLLLRTLMQMPYREISLALDIAEGTAMSHVHRARTALREKLSSDASPSPFGKERNRKLHD